MKYYKYKVIFIISKILPISTAILYDILSIFEFIVGSPVFKGSLNSSSPLAILKILLSLYYSSNLYLMFLIIFGNYAGNAVFLAKYNKYMQIV
jgi:hypothetical protein